MLPPAATTTAAQDPHVPLPYLVHHLRELQGAVAVRVPRSQQRRGAARRAAA